MKKVQLTTIVLKLAADVAAAVLSLSVCTVYVMCSAVLSKIAAVIAAAYAFYGTADRNYSGLQQAAARRSTLKLRVRVT